MNTLTSSAFSLLLVLFTVIPNSLSAQKSDDPNQFKQQFNMHFNYASRVLELAKAMPAEKYNWRPMEGVSSVEEVYTHIAQSNFYYLENSLDIPAPENVDVDNIESITGKDSVVAILEQSINHVKESIKAMPASKISKKTTMYGREANGQAVLMQLITHMSEHVGQSIAYARTNGVVPPWSE